MWQPPIRREGVSEQVYVLLRDRILSGELSAGAALTAERDLAEEYGVNRHAIREAVKRLQQARLVAVSHGGRTLVQDWRETAGLDLVVELAQSGEGVAAPELAFDALEMRACIGADAARLCAGRCSSQTAEEVVAAAERYEQAGPDLAALGAADVAWWRLIVQGSGNLAYLLAFNSLVHGSLTAADMPMDLRAAELLDVEAHTRLAGFIADREPERAERQARDLLGRSVPSRTGEATRR
ncbi:FadR family transcriptional regulator [Streptomyces armeniacus]|uniref:FadR family transcriptional regulator n=1 Tax=Streptomyces armeniacus TaxID=83291 RepID=A0A345XTB7_9ACTN|nr:GntR family transcriptional regulator [Streptomyces armeniacus]AXK34883.1 FadR family transcriptional regulator [Streptomyces armeniacus]